MIKWMICLSLFCNPAFAAFLEDVKILGTTQEQNNLKLKLQVKDGKTDSFFFLNVRKEDPESFEKLNAVIQKLSSSQNYQLNLDIPGFSAFRSRGSYGSKDVEFSVKEKK